MTPNTYVTIDYVSDPDRFLRFTYNGSLTVNVYEVTTDPDTGAETMTALDCIMYQDRPTRSEVDETTARYFEGWRQ